MIIHYAPGYPPSTNRRHHEKAGTERLQRVPSATVETCIMIDLHCHLLPGIDDGSPDIATSLTMARMACADGTTTIFCTPHIYPGLYENKAADIRRRVASLQVALHDKGIGLVLNYGADVHLVPNTLADLRSGLVPTLGGSRYLLLEPSHHVRPPRFRESVFELVANGVVPVLTHPERLTWAMDSYDEFLQLAKSGAWLQVTGGALLGTFGRQAKHLAERLVGDGWCAVLASDGHTTGRRAPLLAQATYRAAQLVGGSEAERMVRLRPQAVIDDVAPKEIPLPPALAATDNPVQGKISKLLSGFALFRRR